MTIQDTIIQALEASSNAHRMALTRIDMLASERAGLVSRITELETEVGALRSQIAHGAAEEAAHLTSIQALIADLAQAVEKTKFVLGEPRSAVTSPPDGEPHGRSAPPDSDETDKQAPALAALAAPAGFTDGPTAPDAGSPALQPARHGDDSAISSGAIDDRNINLRGGLDHVTKDIIWGWIQDLDHQMEQITVILKQNRQEVARTIANAYRQDLHQDGIGDGCYGYFFKIDDNTWPHDYHNLELFYVIEGAEIRALDEKLKNLQVEREARKDNV